MHKRREKSTREDRKVQQKRNYMMEKERRVQNIMIK